MQAFALELYLAQPWHQLDKIARPVPAIQLLGQNPVPAVLYRTVRAGQCEHIDPARHHGAGAGRGRRCCRARPANPDQPRARRDRSVAAPQRTAHFGDRRTRPHELAPLFREWLALHFPDRADKVMHTVQAMREGKDNDPSFFTRMKPLGVWADLFRARFRNTTKRLGMNEQRMTLDCSQFVRPETGGQLRLI